MSDWNVMGLGERVAIAMVAYMAGVQEPHLAVWEAALVLAGIITGYGLIRGLGQHVWSARGAGDGGE